MAEYNLYNLKDELRDALGETFINSIKNNIINLVKYDEQRSNNYHIDIFVDLPIFNINKKKLRFLIMKYGCTVLNANLKQLIDIPGVQLSTMYSDFFQHYVSTYKRLHHILYWFFDKMYAVPPNYIRTNLQATFIFMASIILYPPNYRVYDTY